MSLNVHFQVERETEASYMEVLKERIVRISVFSSDQDGLRDYLFSQRPSTVKF